MDPMAAVLLVVVLAPIVFIVGRKLSLWYFRIDEQVALLEGIRDELRKANGEAPAPPPPTPAADRLWVGRLAPDIKE
jgi:hypothetical protein